MGLVTGPHAAPPRTHSHWVMGPAARPEGRQSGSGERPTPDAPHPGRRRPPRAPSCRPHSAPSQLAKSPAVGSVMGPHAAPPRMHSQWVVGPGSPSRGQAVGGGRAPDPGRPTARQEAPPPGTLMLPPHDARVRAVGLVTGPHARIPPQPQPVGSGPQQPAQRAGSRGWESARPRTPHSQAGGAPPGALVPPPQRAKPARKSARCGVGDGSPHPQPPAPTASG